MGSVWYLVTLAVAVVLGAAQTPPGLPLTPGIVLDRSARIRPGTYRLPSSSIERPAVTIRGENIAIDLTGVTIEGADPLADPDTFGGTGIIVDGGRGVTIQGGTIRGFKVGILARRSPALRLREQDLSYNWKPRLRSGYEQEHQSDWLSFHQNERDEWLRYGAAIYLTDSDDAEVDRVRAVQGMNGLMVTRSARVTISNNTFSWLSGVGVGLYRTTDSRIVHNRLDWCVRGYSHGFYFRGQDSTGLLMYEQSSRNLVAHNSITHGGDGVFLWAGQSTMDTGQGGANDNVFYDNDVSHAVANGIEATFSRNTIVGNRIDDSWHGIWGGYSFDSVIADNTFAGNTEGMAIEHGQNITIRGNTFSGGETAIRLWSNATQDPNWGYPKARDTRSRDYVIAGNRFESVATALNVMRTSGVRIADNVYRGVEMPLRQGAAVEALVERALDAPLLPVVFTRPAPLADAIDAKLPAGARRGRATIIVDEWGPYDYRSPKLWPAGPLEWPLTLRVLGPSGSWAHDSDPRGDGRAIVWCRARRARGHSDGRRGGRRDRDRLPGSGRRHAARSGDRGGSADPRVVRAIRSTDGVGREILEVRSRQRSAHAARGVHGAPRDRAAQDCHAVTTWVRECPGVRRWIHRAHRRHRDRHRRPAARPVRALDHERRRNPAVARRPARSAGLVDPRPQRGSRRTRGGPASAAPGVFPEHRRGGAAGAGAEEVSDIAVRI